MNILLSSISIINVNVNNFPLASLHSTAVSAELNLMGKKKKSKKNILGKIKTIVFKKGKYNDIYIYRNFR